MIVRIVTKIFSQLYHFIPVLAGICKIKNAPQARVRRGFGGDKGT